MSTPNAVQGDPSSTESDGFSDEMSLPSGAPPADNGSIDVVGTASSNIANESDTDLEDDMSLPSGAPPTDNGGCLPVKSATASSSNADEFGIDQVSVRSEKSSGDERGGIIVDLTSVKPSPALDNEGDGMSLPSDEPSVDSRGIGVGAGRSCAIPSVVSVKTTIGPMPPPPPPEQPPPPPPLPSCPNDLCSSQKHERYTSTNSVKSSDQKQGMPKDEKKRSLSRTIVALTPDKYTANPPKKTNEFSFAEEKAVLDGINMYGFLKDKKGKQKQPYVGRWAKVRGHIKHYLAKDRPPTCVKDKYVDWMKRMTKYEEVLWRDEVTVDGRKYTFFKFTDVYLEERGVQLKGGAELDYTYFIPDRPDPEEEYDFTNLPFGTNSS